MNNDNPEIVYDKEGNPHEVVDFNNDNVGSKLGFWLFLFTELMLFGAMFLVFSFFFYRFTDDFVIASSHLHLTLGGINTVVLLISTYFMGMASLNMKLNNIDKSKKMIYITILLSIIFLAIKYFEWMAEIQNGIYPNSEALNELAKGEILFFGLYFTMTGFHGLHIIVGIGVMLWAIKLINNKKINASKSIVLENIALYWDLVHLVWVFLFPLFYMISFGGTQ
ncbi:MAG: cytochrome c oxidase subunit 3 [Arcobacter sp.]|uniref:cytochrome c oxidase subunit 3 n=1 Tax=Arcobacter sp. TaxID=1872629 RepID=UPI003B00D837